MEDRVMTSSSNRSGSLMNLGGEVADLTGEVHHLPCCIKFSGPSDISHYFKPKPTGIVIEGMAVEKAYFRGRELLGATTPIPHGYSGFVVASEKDAKDDSCTWKARAKFTTAAFWNHDSLPSQNDTSFRSLHWLTVSDALHKPVTAEELAAAPV
uniref:Uncharacterized protein n=1 Tax=Kalanchoe fedtschenkoi TaxID=63787 RepID=A0A7N0T3M1_KALFE